MRPKLSRSLTPKTSPEADIGKDRYAVLEIVFADGSVSTSRPMKSCGFFDSHGDGRQGLGYPQIFAHD